MAEDTITDPGTTEAPDVRFQAPDVDAGADAPETRDTGDLGEAGRKALAEERKARREAERARKELQAELDQLRARSQQTDDEAAAQAAADKIRREAEAEAKARADRRISSAELRAEATGKLADPADALVFIDASQFEVDEDGNVDRTEMAEAISDLIKKRPYLAAKAQGFQGTGDGGARGERGPKQVSEAELKTMSPEAIVKARQEGRLTALQGG